MIFLALLFNPAAWSMQRVIRDHFYASVTFLVLAGAVGTLTHRRKGLWNLDASAPGAGKWKLLAAVERVLDYGLYIPARAVEATVRS